MKFLILLILLTIPESVFASWQVWPESIFKATSGHDKIQKSYDPGTYPSTFSIKAAKNEYCIFQLAARSSGEAMVGFTPSIQTTFTSGTNTIPNSNVTFYLENFISTIGVLNNGSMAYEPAGDWPDILVPYRDRFYNEIRNGTDSGWGQTVVANTTQPFLVEVYIPPTTPAGTYTGVIRLTSSPLPAKDITVSITVWNFALPAQWTLKTSFGTEYYTADNVGTNNGTSAAKIEYDFRMFQLLLDHGINLYGDSGSKYNVNAYGDIPTFNHANFTNANFGFKNFLDHTAGQAYFQKTLPIPNFWSIRNDDGTSGWSHDITYLNNWGTFMSPYLSTTLFADKFVDEPPDVATVNSYAATHASRHSGAGEYPARPYEYYTAMYATEGTKTNFWDDTYGHMWVTIIEVM